MIRKIFVILILCIIAQALTGIDAFGAILQLLTCLYKLLSIFFLWMGEILIQAAG